MSHHPGNATGMQQTPGRYRVAGKVVSLPGTRDADLNSKGPHNKRPGPRLLTVCLDDDHGVRIRH
jgi:hypothetical protein